MVPGTTMSPSGHRRSFGSRAAFARSKYMQHSSSLQGSTENQSLLLGVSLIIMGCASSAIGLERVQDRGLLGRSKLSRCYPDAGGHRGAWTRDPGSYMASMSSNERSHAAMRTLYC